MDHAASWQDEPHKRLNIRDIVNGLQPFVEQFLLKLEEATKQEEIRQKQWEEEQERSRRETDRRMIAQSVIDSRNGIERVMQDWSYAVNVEKFFIEVEDRVNQPHLSKERRQQIMDRLNLAREFLRTSDPLDLLMSWHTPTERYQPKYNKQNK